MTLLYPINIFDLFVEFVANVSNVNPLNQDSSLKNFLEIVILSYIAISYIFNGHIRTHLAIR